MYVSILLLVLVDHVVSQQRSCTSRWSTIRTTADRVLVGHVISTQRLHDFMLCAQECLKHARCASVNYEEVKNGVCELNEKGLEISTDTSLLSWRGGYVFGQLVHFNDSFGPRSEKEAQGKNYLKFEFTTLCATGRTGPQSTSGYENTPLEGKIQLDQGIQIWTVPVNGSYVIEALGASGANGTCQAGTAGCSPNWMLGGLGAKIKGTFLLIAGTKIKILVGQEGHRNNDFGQRPGGGGGGSFVTFMNDVPLVVAGGGGGGGLPRPDFGNGDPGQISENGSRCGGSAGQGGHHCNVDTGQVIKWLAGGGGAGLKGDGVGFGAFTGAFSFVNGGKGGEGTASQGGFGGGGFGMTQSGGGGGYSGGGIEGAADKGYAGGGGSYNSGKLQENKAGINKGDGGVTITLR